MKDDRERLTRALQSAPDPNVDGHWRHDAVWARYDDFSAERGPCYPLRMALESYQRRGTPPARAMDLGCGSGRDALELLRRGWRVVAVDGRREALERLLANIDADRSRLQLVLSSFAELPSMNRGRFELINASHCLHFCGPEHFERFWKHLYDSLVEGGLLCGHFFGANDAWGSDPLLTTPTADEVARYFEKYDVEWLVENERDVRRGHQHVFRFVIRKPGHETTTQKKPSASDGAILTHSSR